MTDYTIEAPDGRDYQIEAPEGATEQMALDWFKQSWADGGITPDMALAKEPGMWEQFKAGYRTGHTDVNNASLWLESRIPLGDIHQTPRQKYGDAFMDMSPDERRQHLIQLRNAEVAQKNKEVTDAGQGDSAAAVTGQMAGTMATPTTLFPVAKGLKGGAVAGGLLGAEHNIFQQLAETGDVSPTEALYWGGIGTLLGGVGGYLSSAFANSIGKLRAKKADKRAVESANTALEKIEEELVVAVNDGVPMKDLPKALTRATGLSSKEMKDAAIVAGRGIKVPTRKEAQIIAEQVDPYVAPSMMKKAATATGAYLDDYIGVLSTRVKNISESAFGKLRKFEFDSHVNSHKALKRVDPFLTGLSKLPKDVQGLVAKQLANGDFDDLRGTLKQYDAGLVDKFKEVTNVLDETYTGLGEAGYDTLGFVKNYFPRYVTNIDGLYSKLGKKQQSLLEIALEKKAAQLGLKSTKSIPKADRIDVTNKVLRGYLPKTQEGRLGFSKVRSIERLNDDLIADYATPAEALHTYLRRATADIEKRKFFGKGAAKEGSKIDLTKSIGNMVQEEMEKGMSAADADELTRLLQARFGPGEQSPAALLQGLRNIGHATTIANPYSAATQIGDIGVSAYVNGVRNTTKGLLGKRHVKMEDFGLEDVIAEEFATTGKTAKALNYLFTKSGFRAVDKLGKTTVLNAALQKGWTQASNTKGRQALAEKYSKVFGNEFSGLMDDLQAGRVTENVKLFLWNELSDVQPISLSEMPLKYLEVPNGRIMYTLKTFAIRQLDLLRKDIAQQYAKGNKKEATRNAVRYAALVGFTGATVDQAKGLMGGEGFHPEDIPEGILENVFKTFGASQYIRDKYLGKGQVAAALLETISPPVDWMNAIGADIMNIASGEEDVPKETLRQLPVIGKAWYMFLGGGLEKARERELQEMFEDERI